ncbi:hypothetical protein [Anaplasma capra]|nr:hypothetical protein [Anaplasma capra]MCU7611983.1 hypothetical protein [Anaplasma capra]
MIVMTCTVILASAAIAAVTFALIPAGSDELGGVERILLIVLSVALFIAAACCARFCGGTDRNGSREYYISAELIGTDARNIPLRGNFHIDNCLKVHNSNGIEARINPDSYNLTVAKCFPSRLGLKRGHMVFKPKFSTMWEKQYFEQLVEHVLGAQPSDAQAGRSSAISAKTSHGRVKLSVEVPTEGRVVEHIFNTMSSTEKLNSGEGVRFFRWYCQVCKGVLSRSSHLSADAEGSPYEPLFQDLPSVWVAAYYYDESFRRVAEYSKAVWYDSLRYQGPVRECLLRDEVKFLEDVKLASFSYQLSGDARICAEQELERMLIAMYVFSVSDMCRDLRRDNVLSWLKGVLSDGAGEKRTALCMALSPIGSGRFFGKFLRRLYAGLCADDLVLSTFNDYMSGLIELCDSEISDDRVLEICKLHGMDICAASAVLLPHFVQTKAHRVMLRDSAYKDRLASIMRGVRTFEKLYNQRAEVPGSASSILRYDWGERLFGRGRDSRRLETPILLCRLRVLKMLKEFPVLDVVCNGSETDSPSSVLKFIVYLRVWMWEAKELTLISGPLDRKFCTFLCTLKALLTRYSYVYWERFGDYMVMSMQPECDPGRFFFRDRVRTEFLVEPDEKSLKVGYGGALSNVIPSLIHNQQEGQNQSL